jgi:hypothetical protein
METFRILSKLLFWNVFSGQRDIIVERGVDDDSDEIETEEQNKILVDDEQSLDKSLHSVEKRAAFKYKFLREMSSPKTVEMLVVVDKNMYHKHGDANITTYTLTLFNMVSLLCFVFYSFWKTVGCWLPSFILPVILLPVLLTVSHSTSIFSAWCVTYLVHYMDCYPWVGFQFDKVS